MEREPINRRPWAAEIAPEQEPLQDDLERFEFQLKRLQEITRLSRLDPKRCGAPHQGRLKTLPPFDLALG